MSGQIDKSLVKKRFKKSLKTYRKNAPVQKRMAGKLVNRLIEKCRCNYSNIFEIGAGEGLLTELISRKLTYDHLVINDLIEESESCIRRFIDNFDFIGGDIEKINIPSNFDLIISNATFQWFENLPDVFKKLSLSLNAGGILAFTTFGPKNLKEILNLTGVSLNYYDLNEIKTMYNQYFTCIDYSSVEYKLTFDSPLDVLKHIKNSGTNCLNSKTWTKKDIEIFENKYTEMYDNGRGCKLTYQPYWFILKLK